jgi:hypothetical protein
LLQEPRVPSNAAATSGHHVPAQCGMGSHRRLAA